VLTRIGDTPGMNQVSPRCGHHAFGRSPLVRHTLTRFIREAVVRCGVTSKPSARMASAMEKNSGAAASTPISAGFARPSKCPIHTTTA
jgi:hypothetical protein